MQIKVGDIIPKFEFSAVSADGIIKMTTDEIFGSNKVVLFGVPGAFTPTCSNNHLPSYIDNLGALAAKGVDKIACVSVNDIHVLNAWAKANGLDGRIILLSDGNADFAKLTGLDVALTDFGMGIRNRRFSMYVENCVVKVINVEEKSGVNVSGAETLLNQL